MEEKFNYPVMTPENFEDSNEERGTATAEDCGPTQVTVDELKFEGATAVKVETVQASPELNPVASTVNKLAFGATAVADTAQHVVKTAKDKVEETKEKTSEFTSTVIGATATLFGKEAKAKPAKPVNKVELDNTFDLATNQFDIVLPLRYYQPAVVNVQDFTAAVAEKQRHRAACVTWLLAASKLPRMHQAERYMLGVVSALARLRYVRDDDVFALPYSTSQNVPEAFGLALNEIELNMDTGVLSRVYTACKPLLSVEDTDIIMSGEWLSRKPAVLFEPERFNTIPAETAKQRFVSICGRTQLSTIQFSQAVTRKEILMNRHIAPEDAIASIAMYGLFSLCDLVMLLTMTSTAVRQKSVAISESYAAFDAELGNLYINGAQGGLAKLLELAGAAETDSNQLQAEFCSSLRNPKGILYGTLMFLGRRKMLSKLFYFFCKS